MLPKRKKEVQLDFYLVSLQTFFVNSINSKYPLDFDSIAFTVIALDSEILHQWSFGQFFNSIRQIVVCLL